MISDMFILQIILVLLLFFPIKWLCWKITEQWGLPEWLQYKPWICKKCLTFWTLTGTYLTVGLVFGLYLTLVVGLMITILDTIATIIDQKNKTIKI